MKKFLSRYHPRYIRSLVYMLQASEYNVRDYLRWYRRADDFRDVEKRKSLVWTPKAIVLAMGAWVFVAVVGLYALMKLATGSYVAFLVIALILPFMLPYALIGLLFVLKVQQTPVELSRVRRSRLELAKHTGYKIAIAGSYGKTTMREILKTVLSEGKRVAAPGENYNTPPGVSRFVQTLTGDEEVLIFELGEYYPGDVAALCRVIKPDLGVITGVNEAHLEKFKDLTLTATTVFELAEAPGVATLYVNGESEKARTYASADVVLYARDGAGEWQVKNARTGLDGTLCTLVHSGQEIRVASKLLGLHQLGPLAAAADIATRLGLTPEQIQRGIAKTKPFDHRLEPKKSASGAVLLDDSYNGNPDGAAAVIEFLASLTGFKRWYVTPGLVEMGVRTEAVHRKIGEQLAHAGIENVVLIKNSVTPYIEAGLKTAGYKGELRWFENGPAAFAAIAHLTTERDVVLIQNDWPDQYA